MREEAEGPGRMILTVLWTRVLAVPGGGGGGRGVGVKEINSTSCVLA